jgi:hypothetical protein
MIDVRKEGPWEPAPGNEAVSANARAMTERCLAQISMAWQEAGWGRVDDLKLTFPGISTDIAPVINWRRDR